MCIYRGGGTQFCPHYPHYPHQYRWISGPIFFYRDLCYYVRTVVTVQKVVFREAFSAVSVHREAVIMKVLNSYEQWIIIHTGL